MNYQLKFEVDLDQLLCLNIPGRKIGGYQLISDNGKIKFVDVATYKVVDNPNIVHMTELKNLKTGSNFIFMEELYILGEKSFNDRDSFNAIQISTSTRKIKIEKTYFNEDSLVTPVRII